MRTALAAYSVLALTLSSAWASGYVDPSTKSNYLDIHVEKYTLELNVDPVAHFKAKAAGKAGGYRAVVTYDINVLRPTNQIVFDAVGLEIGEVKRLPENTAVSFTAKDGALTLSFPEALPAKRRLLVSAEVRSATHEAGLQFVPSTATASGKPSAFTQLEDIDARRVFPCQDTPQVHAKFETRLSFPKGMKGYASGTLVSEKKNTRHFATDFTIPTYLYAFTVGNYQSEKVSKDVEVVFEPNVKAQAISYAKNTQGIIDWFATYLDYPYPLNTMRIVFVPGFPWGGMENMGMIFLQERFLVPDNVALPTGLSVLPHEIVHHWYGNTITMADRGQIWVNEGPTSYLDRAYIAHNVSKDAASEMWQESRIDSMSMEFNRKRDPKYSSIRLSYTSAEDFAAAPNGSDRSYDKGPWVLYELRTWLGEEGVKYVLQKLLPRKGEHKKLLTIDQFAQELKTQIAAYAQSKALKLPAELPSYVDALLNWPGHPELDVTCRRDREGHITQVELAQPHASTWKDGTQRHGQVYPLGELAYKYSDAQGTHVAKTPALNARRMALRLPKGTQSLFFDPEGQRFIEVRYGSNCHNFAKGQFVETTGSDHRILAEFATDKAFVEMVRTRVLETAKSKNQTYQEVAQTYPSRMAATLMVLEALDKGTSLKDLVLNQKNVPLRLRTAEALVGVLSVGDVSSGKVDAKLFRQALAQEKAYTIAPMWYVLSLLSVKPGEDATELRQDLEKFLSRFLPMPGWQSLFAQLSKLATKHEAGAQIGLEAILRQGAKTSVPNPTAKATMLNYLKRAGADSTLTSALKAIYPKVSKQDASVSATYKDWSFARQ